MYMRLHKSTLEYLQLIHLFISLYGIASNTTRTCYVSEPNESVYLHYTSVYE